jgi:hypothetical protein
MNIATLRAREENRLLREIFGPMKAEGSQQFGMLYNEKLLELHSSPN